MVIGSDLMVTELPEHVKDAIGRPDVDSLDVISLFNCLETCLTLNGRRLLESQRGSLCGAEWSNICARAMLVAEVLNGALLDIEALVTADPALQERILDEHERREQMMSAEAEEFLRAQAS